MNPFRVATLASLPLAALAAFSLSACDRACAKVQPQVIIETRHPELKRDVKTTPVESLNRPAFIRVTGSLAADEQSDLAGKVGGNVLEVHVDRGSFVKKGDPIVSLDPVTARNTLAEAQAAAAELQVRLGISKAADKFEVLNQPEVKSARLTFELAEKNYQRDKDLAEKKVLPKADFDKTSMEYAAARQRYELSQHEANRLFQSYKTAVTRVRSLEQSVADTIIRAPYDGMIAEKHVSPGEAVLQGAKVATLVKTDPLRLVVTIPEQYVSLVQPGAQVEFNVSAYKDETFSGTVRFVGPSLENQSRALTVEAIVPNPDAQLRPGYFASARVFQTTGTEALAVPQSAVKREGDVAKVFIVREDGVVREQVVGVGESLEGRMEITSGLTSGTTVVVEAGSVFDGVRVR